MMGSAERRQRWAKKQLKKERNKRERLAITNMLPVQREVMGDSHRATGSINNNRRLT